MILDAPALTLSDVFRSARADTPVVRGSGVGVHSGYQKDPVRWMVEQLRIPEHTIRWSKNPGYQKHVWDGTPDPLVAGLEAIAAGRWIAAEAGTGTQKTYVFGAGAMLWFLSCFENAIVVTIAPKEDQLKLHLWKEARELWPKFHLRFPRSTLTDLKIRMRGGLDEKWTATGFIAGVGANEEAANRARGFHAEHALFIFEEAPGIHHAIGAAIDFTCTAPHNLQIRYGNPDNEQDSLHQFAQREDVAAIRISALDHPNVVCNDASIVPGAASVQSVTRMRREHGEGSALFNAKVRGIAPQQAVDALIQWRWCEEAAARYDDLVFRHGLPALGVDVADSPNGDEYAIARGIGACLMELECAKIGENPTITNAGELGAQIALEIELSEIDEMNVGIDSVGVGAATINELKRLKFHVRALNGGAKPQPRVDGDVLREDKIGVAPVELFADFRSQQYWQIRQDLMHGRIALLLDKDLFRELTMPRWERVGGKILVEPKETPKKGGKGSPNWGVRQRLGRSPNRADAVVYWNWVRHRSALPDDVQPESLWAPHVLAGEADESRRVRSKKLRDIEDLSPDLIEALD